MISFDGEIGNSNNSVYYLHIIVPKHIVKELKFEGKAKRILFAINGAESFPAAFMPKGNGDFFININKKLIKKHNLKEGSKVKVVVEKDTSKYGMPIPEEFEIALAQDREAAAFFDSLTPGRQRNLIHLVYKVKSTDVRIRKSLVILHHLKYTSGIIDFKLLNEQFKEANKKGLG